MKTEKKTGLFFLAALIAGSAVTFYATNLLLSDLGNMAYEKLSFFIVSSLPAFFLALCFVLLLFVLTELAAQPGRKKRLGMTSMTALAVLSGCGFVSSVLTGAFVYRDFLAPYPFSFYTVIALAVFGALFVLALVMRKRFSVLRLSAKRPQDGIFAVILKVLYWPFAYFAMDRLGALIFAPVYAQKRTLAITSPFYVSLLLPAMVLVYVYFRSSGFVKKHVTGSVIWLWTVNLLNVITGLLILYEGTTDTRFVSAISPALGLERLATKPLVVPVHFALVLVTALPMLVILLKKKKQ